MYKYIIKRVYIEKETPDKSVQGWATGWMAEDLAFDSWNKQEIFLSSTPSRPAGTEQHV